MHTLLDYEGSLPAYVHVSNGKMADNKAAYKVPLIKGSVIVADQYYNDFSLLNVWDSNEVYFVVRHKDNLSYRSIEENPLPEQRHQEVLIDEWIELTGHRSAKKYPRKLRRVAVWDAENGQTILYPTWAASTIGKLYKSRWQVEIFFRGIKQLLNIKSFIGTTANAVMIQIWTALITILVLKAWREMAKIQLVLV